MNLSLLLVGLTLTWDFSAAVDFISTDQSLLFNDFGNGRCRDSVGAFYDYLQLTDTTTFTGDVACADICVADFGLTHALSQFVGIDVNEGDNTQTKVCRCLFNDGTTPTVIAGGSTLVTTKYTAVNSLLGTGVIAGATLEGNGLTPQCYQALEGVPSSSPSSNPSLSMQPSNKPSQSPSRVPSASPSGQPSGKPSQSPSGQPSGKPSQSPSGQPSLSAQPSAAPSKSPSQSPSISAAPSTAPSSVPSAAPVGSKNNGKPRGPFGNDPNLVSPTAVPVAATPVAVPVAVPVSVPLAAVPVAVPVMVPVTVPVGSPVATTGKAPKAAKKAKSPSASKGNKLVASKDIKRRL